MAADLSRILIETVVKMTLRNIKDSPERSIRNLVDMAQEFTIPGRFSQQFFGIAQGMLSNEHSPYYALIRDVVSNVDDQKLMTFGMNVGYNSCTVGAKTIRQIETEEDFNIPWSIVLEIDSQQFTRREQDYNAVIDQGNKLGIYTWPVFTRGDLLGILPLVEGHKENAFIFFCRPEEVREELLAEVKDMNNLMLSVLWTKGVDDACALLRRERFPYSIYFTYDQDKYEQISGEELVRDMEQLHPIFCIFLPEPGCPDEIQKKVSDWVLESRQEQRFQTILMEGVHDSQLVDSIISEDACSVVFNAEGLLADMFQTSLHPELNLFQTPLKEILRQAAPKKK